MKKLIIVGAGGWGREVLAQAQKDPGHHTQWEVEGFLDSRLDLHQDINVGIPIIGDPLTHQVEADNLYLCAIGDPEAREYYAKPLLAQKAKFITLRSQAFLSPRNYIDLGSIICHRVQISPDVRIGKFVNIQSCSIVSHDVKIGDFSHIGAMVFIGGNVDIGRLVTIHPHSTILPNIKIGNGAIIGAGSVVIKDIPAGITVFGNPARNVFSKSA